MSFIGNIEVAPIIDREHRALICAAFCPVFTVSAMLFSDFIVAEFRKPHET